MNQENLRALVEETGKRAMAALDRGEYRAAANIYQELSSNSQLDAKVRNHFTAWVMYCSGRAELAEDSINGHSIAEPNFMGAEEIFKKEGCFDMQLLTGPFRLWCEGRRLAREDLDQGIEKTKQARDGFLHFAKRGNTEYQRWALEADIALCGLLAVADSREGDHDGADNFVHERQNAVNSLVKFLGTDPEAAAYAASQGYYVGLILLARAFKARESVKYGEAVDLISRAKSNFEESSQALERTQIGKPAWIVFGKLLKGAVELCHAANAEVDALKHLLNGFRVGFPAECSRVASAYDKARSQLGQAEKLDPTGFRVAAKQRDFWLRMAEVTERDGDHQYDYEPPFDRIIKNIQLVEIVRRDYREILIAFHGSAWKSSLVGIGGLLEALLIDAVQSNWQQVLQKCTLSQKDAAEPVTEWKLVHLIERSTRADLISKGNKHYSDALRDYRNLVHPGKEIGSSDDISEGAVKTALAALHLVIEDLKRFYGVQ